MKFPIILLAVSVLTGCVPKAVHVYQSSPLPEEQLAYLFENEDEVVVELINGIPVSRYREYGGRSLVKPGLVKITARYSWRSISAYGGMIIKGRAHERGSQTRCFKVIAGERYEVKSTPPSIRPWRLYLSNGGEMKPVACEEEE